MRNSIPPPPTLWKLPSSSSMYPESVDAPLHLSRERSGWTVLALPRPSSRTTWEIINAAAEGFPGLVASFVWWQKISQARERERERERRVFTHFEKIKPLQMGGEKSKYSRWILEMCEYGGLASAISASSPQPALKEKCLAADRRVHSPRVVSAGILSGILMASGFSSTQGPALSMHAKI